MTRGTKKIELLLEAVVAIAAIVALIPAFGQWQDLHTPASNSASSVGDVRPTPLLAATTSPQTELQTVVIVTATTLAPTPTFTKTAGLNSQSQVEIVAAATPAGTLENGIIPFSMPGNVNTLNPDLHWEPGGSAASTQSR